MGANIDAYGDAHSASWVLLPGVGFGPTGVWGATARHKLCVLSGDSQCIL